jgi:hypothetical protein
VLNSAHTQRVLKSAVTKSHRLHPLVLNKHQKKKNQRCRAHERLALLLLYLDAALLLLYCCFTQRCRAAQMRGSTAASRHQRFTQLPV